MYHSSQPLEPGDVVVIDSGTKDSVTKSTGIYQGSLAGVISTDPGLILRAGEIYDETTREKDPTFYPVALSGRVPVKVSSENGPIQSGDPLTSSSVPGVAMKAAAPGQTVGIALEAFAAEGQGKILCFVSVAERNTADGLKALQQENTSLRQSLHELREKVEKLLQQ
jgi:hypothetical protein